MRKYVFPKPDVFADFDFNTLDQNQTVIKNNLFR